MTTTKISSQLLGKTAFYETEYYDGKGWNKICDFAKVDSITIDAANGNAGAEYLTVKDNKGRFTNFCTKSMQQQNKYIALDIAILKFI